MIRAFRSSSALIGTLGCVLSSAALADNPIGLYAGVGVGLSNVNNNNYDYPYGYNGGFHDRDAAWKVLLGVRPVHFLGAELEYLDFGSGHGSNGFYGPNDYYDYGPFSHPKAEVLYGVGYLPLPLPLLDVYGKVGVARLQTNISYQTCTSVVLAPGGGLNCTGTATSRIDQTNTNFAFGAGVQTKFQDLAFRAEYERIESSYGNPSTFMVSATWSF
jgi:opacity protein-like surface antigen